MFHMIAGGPKPVAPFSHAVETDGFVFVTGQMPDTPATPGVLPDGIVEQTKAVMKNLKTVLNGLNLAASTCCDGEGLSDALQRRLCGDDETYQQYFAPDRRPARTCVGVTGLAYDALIEIDLICRRP